MIYLKNFSNYDEFQKLFPVVEHNNGKKSRKNLILLGCLKDRKFIHWWLQFKKKYDNVSKGWWDIEADILTCKDMISLREFLKTLCGRYTRLYNTWSGNEKRTNRLCNEWRLFSDVYHIDQKGLCEDGMVNSIRCENLEKRKIFRMKASKFISQIIEENEATSIMPIQAKRWIAEEFATEWQAYAEEKIGYANSLTLCVGGGRLDFAEIYDSDYCLGDFGSCMEDEGQYDFYVDAVDASAACLKNSDGNIIVRCVIFNEVYDEDGNVWRLAERQYASDGQDVLKQILINKLIAEGRIDGYKKVGVNCHDNRNFISVNGESLIDKKFHIACNLEEDDTMSYQDSFKYYDYNSRTAYNYPADGHTDELDVTSHSFERSHKNEVYSDIYEEYIPEDVAVYDNYHSSYIYENDATDAIYHGDNIHLFEEDTDDFLWSDREGCFIYEDECVYIESIEDFVLTAEAVEDINGVWQLEEDCDWSYYENGYILKEEAVYSKAYKEYYQKKSSVYSELLKDWFKDEDDMKDEEEQYRKKQALMSIA